MPQHDTSADRAAPRRRFGKITGFQDHYSAAVFAVYLILLAAAIYNHEPWMDEAQAWLLAKDLSVAELFVKYLRYEGSPGLWHLILMIPAKLGLPYFTLNVISGVIAAAGVWLFLRYSPFPTIIKILFPFSYFVFFQYGVVARSYCLIAPLLFLIAIKYEARIKQPFVYVLLLGLLANVSFHTLLLASAFLGVHLLSLIKVWRNLDTKIKIHQTLAATAFGLLIGLLYLVISPPADQLFASNADFRLDTFLNIGKLAIVGSLVADETHESVWLGFTASLAIFLWTLVWLLRQKTVLLYLLSLVPLLAFFAVKYRNLWHLGIVFLLWFFVLWISFDKNRNEKPSLMSKTMIAVITLVLGVQVYWSGCAVQYDFTHNYSGSYQIAEYLRANNLTDKKIFASGWKAIAIAPYFDDKIFYNHNENTNRRFWFWSSQNQTPVGFNESVLEAIERGDPDIVIFASDHLDPNTKIDLDGYRFTAVFEGNICWKTGLYEPDSFMVFSKVE